MYINFPEKVFDIRGSNVSVNDNLTNINIFDPINSNLVNLTSDVFSNEAVNKEVDIRIPSVRSGDILNTYSSNVRYVPSFSGSGIFTPDITTGGIISEKPMFFILIHFLLAENQIGDFGHLSVLGFEKYMIENFKEGNLFSFILSIANIDRVKSEKTTLDAILKRLNRDNSSFKSRGLDYLSKFEINLKKMCDITKSGNVLNDTIDMKEKEELIFDKIQPLLEHIKNSAIALRFLQLLTVCKREKTLEKEYEVMKKSIGESEIYKDIEKFSKDLLGVFTKINPLDKTPLVKDLEKRIESETNVIETLKKSIEHENIEQDIKKLKDARAEFEKGPIKIKLGKASCSCNLL